LLFRDPKCLKKSQKGAELLFNAMRQYVREPGYGGSNFTGFRTKGSKALNHGDELLIETESEDFGTL
jgi:hypothetical protein